MSEHHKIHCYRLCEMFPACPVFVMRTLHVICWDKVFSLISISLNFFCDARSNGTTSFHSGVRIFKSKTLKYPFPIFYLFSLSLSSSTITTISTLTKGAWRNSFLYRWNVTRVVCVYNVPKYLQLEYLIEVGSSNGNDNRRSVTDSYAASF